LRLTALDARQSFNLVLGLFNRRGRMGTKIRFQGCVMFLQRTLRPHNRDFFQALHSTVLIELKVVAQRVLGDIHQLCNLSVW